MAVRKAITEPNYPASYQPGISRDSGAIFNMKQNDVVVFLHIQKTGGSTLEQFLTEEMEFYPKCKVTRFVVFRFNEVPFNT